MDLADLTPEEEMALRLLALYDQTENIEEFCGAIELDPAHPDSIALYERTRDSSSEIRDALGEDAFDAAMEQDPMPGELIAKVQAATKKAESDIVLALVSLGYDRASAAMTARAVVDRHPDWTLEEQVSAALRLLVPAQRTPRDA